MIIFLKKDNSLIIGVYILLTVVVSQNCISMLFCFFCRISPRSRETHPNPEEPEEEDEDVQAERVQAANTLTTPNLAEVDNSD